MTLRDRLVLSAHMVRTSVADADSSTLAKALQFRALSGEKDAQTLIRALKSSAKKPRKALRR